MARLRTPQENASAPGRAGLSAGFPLPIVSFRDLPLQVSTTVRDQLSGSVG